MPKKSANMEALLHQTHSSSWELVFEGIKVNNLKNLDLKLPKNKLITITGVSWSGKSSLAFLRKVSTDILSRSQGIWGNFSIYEIDQKSTIVADFLLLLQLNKTKEAETLDQR